MAGSICWDGKWFCVTGSWVFPKHLLKMVESLPDEYANQHTWHLRDVEVGSRDEAKQVLTEFLDATSSASSRFGWLKTSHRDRTGWKKHAWKHVRFGDLEQVAMLARPPLFANRLLDFLSKEEATELCSRARSRDPRAVAELTYLLPDDQERLSEARVYLGESLPASAIPSAYELADEYVRFIYQEPDSKKVAKAQKNLKVLTSLKSVRGQSGGRGRAREEVDADVVRLLYEMASAVFIQLREVDGFLSRLKFSAEDRHRLLLDFYPWLVGVKDRDVQGSVPNFLTMKPTHARLLISEIVLKLSPSKIEKTVYPKRN